MDNNSQFLNMVRAASRRVQYGARWLEDHADQVVSIAGLLADAFENGGKVIVMGNGGSAACSQHFAAEFTSRLAIDRPPLPAISLTVDTSALTAIANDFGYEEVFARQLRALAGPNDVVIGLSTSGTSPNVQRGFEYANSIGATTISLTGSSDKLGAKHNIGVALVETARIQEVHDLILHEVAQIAERMVNQDMGNDASANPFPFDLSDVDIADFRSWIHQNKLKVVTETTNLALMSKSHRNKLRDSRASGHLLVVLVEPDLAAEPLAELLDDLAAMAAVDHVVVLNANAPEWQI